MVTPPGGGGVLGGLGRTAEREAEKAGVKPADVIFPGISVMRQAAKASGDQTLIAAVQNVEAIGFDLPPLRAAA